MGGWPARPRSRVGEDDPLLAAAGARTCPSQCEQNWGGGVKGTSAGARESGPAERPLSAIRRAPGELLTQEPIAKSRLEHMAEPPDKAMPEILQLDP